MYNKMENNFLLIDSSFNVLKINNDIFKEFSGLPPIIEGENIIECFRKAGLPDMDESANKITNAISQNCISSFFIYYNTSDISEKYKVDIIPLYSGKEHLYTLLKFNGYYDNPINKISLIELEKLATLGKMIGGIAHNLKSPIMAISGAINGIKDLASEYQNSIGNSSVTDSDHMEIAEEMINWIDRVSPYLSYMSEVISSVKGQAVMSDKSNTWITLEEIIRRIELLMGYEFKYNHCTLKVDLKAPPNVKINISPSLLLQVINNLLGNAIDAYEGNKGIIDLIIEQKDSCLEFIIKDYAKGIPEELKEKIFKETITSKGEKGTGLGLYNSHLITKNVFNGELWFDSQIEKGTVFHIKIPLNKA